MMDWIKTQLLYSDTHSKVQINLDFDFGLMKHHCGTRFNFCCQNVLLFFAHFVHSVKIHANQNANAKNHDLPDCQLVVFF